MILLVLSSCLSVDYSLTERDSVPAYEGAGPTLSDSAQPADSALPELDVAGTPPAISAPGVPDTTAQCNQYVPEQGHVSRYAVDDPALGGGAAKVLSVGPVEFEGAKAWGTTETGEARDTTGALRTWTVVSYHDCADGLRLLAIEADYDFPVGGGIVSRRFTPPLLVYPADLGPGSVWDYRSTVTEEHEDFNRTIVIDAVRSAEARDGGALTVTETRADGRSITLELSPGVGVTRGPTLTLLGVPGR